MAAISSSREARVPEPGLPTLNFLPFMSVKFFALSDLLASTVNGSGCRLITARRSP
ncbi:hypothetical protein D3C83_280400 [compost metagenome]